jgi:hypothetical protein
MTSSVWPAPSTGPWRSRAIMRSNSATGSPAENAQRSPAALQLSRK